MASGLHIERNNSEGEKETSNGAAPPALQYTSRGKGNPYSRTLKPEMLKTPYPLEYAEGLRSDYFCYEKALKTLIEALDLQSKDEWLKFADEVWKWKEKRSFLSAFSKFKAEIAKLGLPQESIDKLLHDFERASNVQ